MYVCPQMTNIYSSTCLRFRIHFSMRQPCLNKHSFNHTHTLIPCHTHSMYTVCTFMVQTQQTHTHKKKKTCAKCARRQIIGRKHERTVFSRSIWDAALRMQSKLQEYMKTQTNSDTIQWARSLGSVWKTINHWQWKYTCIELTRMH